MVNVVVAALHGAVLVYGLAGHSSADAACEQTFEQSEPSTTVTLTNPCHAQVPTVVIEGVTDEPRAAAGLTRGVKLNGIGLVDELLTESTLTVRPGGNATWEYWAGFSGHDDREDLRDIHHRKYRYDVAWSKIPLTERYFYYANNKRHLIVSWAPRPNVISYRIPAVVGGRLTGVRIDGVPFALDLQSGEDMFFDLARDPKGAVRLHRYSVAKDGPPPYFWLPENGVTGPIYLVLTSTAKIQLDVIYGLHLTAHYRYDESPLPRLKAGRNMLTISDAPDSSHHAKWTFMLDEHPVICDFESDAAGLSLGPKCRLVAHGLDGITPWSGRQCVRLELPGAGLTVRPEKGTWDWSGVDIVEIRYYCTQPSEGWGVFGFRELDTKAKEETGHYWSGIGRWNKTRQWTTLKWDISRFPRSRVRRFTFHTVGDWSKRDMTLFLDRISVRRKRGDELARKYSAEEIALTNKHFFSETKPPYAGPRRPVPDACQFFPWGCWAGSQQGIRLAERVGRTRREGVIAMMQDFRANGLNTLMSFAGASPGTPEFVELVELAEKYDARLYPQGPHYLNDKTHTYYQQDIAPRLAKAVTPTRDHWGLLAWEIVEEIPASVVPVLTPYYKAMAGLDPKHPCVVVHNQLPAIQADAKLNKPWIMAYDLYPFWAGWRPKQQLNLFTTRVPQWYAAARSSGSTLWMLPQSYGVREDRFGPGHPASVVMAPTPEQIKVQIYLAIAMGSKGIIFFNYFIPDRPDREILNGGVCAFKDYLGRDKPQWLAFGATRRRFKPLEPLLLACNRVDEQVITSTNDWMYIATHARPGHPDERIVHVVNQNCDGAEAAKLGLTNSVSPRTVFDAFTRKRVSTSQLQKLRLEPGEGTILTVADRMPQW